MNFSRHSQPKVFELFTMLDTSGAEKKKEKNVRDHRKAKDDSAAPSLWVAQKKESKTQSRTLNTSNAPLQEAGTNARQQ